MPVFQTHFTTSKVVLSPQFSRYPVKNIADHAMVTIPGAVFALGSRLTHKKFKNSPPHMVQVCPFKAAISPITEAQFRGVMGRWGCSGEPADYPVTKVSFRDFEEYMMRVNRDLKPEDQLGFLTEAEAEHAARGPAVDVRKFMDEMGLYSPTQLMEHLIVNDYYLENFINVDPLKNPRKALALGKNICTDINSTRFIRLINGKGPVFAWYAYATLSGRLTKEDVWYSKDGPTNVSFKNRLNSFGLSDMVGNVWEWCGDVYNPKAYLKLPPCSIDPVNLPLDDTDDSLRVIRGGSYNSSKDELRAACRYGGAPFDYGRNVGCRVAAAVYHLS